MKKRPPANPSRRSPRKAQPELPRFTRNSAASIVNDISDRINRSPTASRLVERLRTAHAKPSARRLFYVWLILTVATFLLGLNLMRLQVFQAPQLLRQARAQQTTFLRPFVPRRTVIDRTGNVLAYDRPVYTLYAHPIGFQIAKTEVAAQIAPILGKTPGEVLAKLSEGESGIRVEYAISEEAADRLQRLAIDGLELAQQQQRLYPQENLAADVVGYVDIDRIGQAGVEYSHANLLERTVRSVRLSRTGEGMMMPDRIPGGFLHMDNLSLQLTIDSRIQRAGLTMLQQQVKKFNAKRGVVIVMDAKDGAIRSLISEPTYDPNKYYNAKVEQFKNWSLTDLYEPGSTFKPLNVAIALEAGAIQPNQIFNDEGAIQVGGSTIQNFDFSEVGAKGPSTVTEILERSSNVGMVRIAQQMLAANYYEWLQKIGLGQSTGSDLPFEVAGQLRDRKTFIETPVDVATASFGQGFSITAMQLMQLNGLLASGGKMLIPHVVKGLYDDKGQQYWQPAPTEPKQIFSPQTTQTVLRMMEAVVQKGTGKVAQIPGYRIGGKTGTAQKAGPNGGYIEGAKITSFVSIFPIDNPRYVVAAVIDEPKGEDAFGSTVAAPIVKAVMEALITVDKIPPSQSDPGTTTPATTPGATPATTPATTPDATQIETPASPETPSATPTPSQTPQ